MHVVNMKAIHPNLTAALDDPTGLAVLGFFIDVSSKNLFFLYIYSSIFVCFQSNHRWFCFLQVLYADNVHFGLISQKLSSVAYKGLRTRLNVCSEKCLMMFQTPALHP